MYDNLTISDILTRVATGQCFNAQDRVDALNHLLGSVVPVEPASKIELITNAMPAFELLMQAGEKIKAIKLHRSITGAGLERSKEFVEALLETHND